MELVPTDEGCEGSGGSGGNLPYLDDPDVYEPTPSPDDPELPLGVYTLTPDQVSIMLQALQQWINQSTPYCQGVYSGMQSLILGGQVGWFYNGFFDEPPTLNPNPNNTTVGTTFPANGTAFPHPIIGIGRNQITSSQSFSLVQYLKHEYNHATNGLPQGSTDENSALTAELQCMNPA